MAGLTESEELELLQLEAEATKSKPGGFKDLIGNLGQAAVETAKSAGSTAMDVGRFVDAYTGAPTRAAVGAAMSGQSPIKAFGAQVGEQPESAPTGAQLYDKSGLPNVDIPLYASGPLLIPNLVSRGIRGKNLSTRDVGGLAADVGLDVTNVIPVGMIAKGAGKAAGMGLRGLIKGAGAAVKGTAAAADLAVGGERAAKAVESIGQIAKRTADTISSIGTPKRVANFAKLAETAKKAGIEAKDLSAAAEFGKTKWVSKLERGLREGPVGGELYQKFVNNGIKLAESVDNSLAKISENRILDPIALGEMMKGGYANAERKMFDGLTVTYKNASQLSPNLQLVPEAYKKLQSGVNGLEKSAAGLMKRGATREQVQMGKDLFGFAQRFKKNGANYKQLSEQIEYIGKAMTDPATPRLQAKKLRDFYSTLSESLIDTVNGINPDLGKQLVDNNKVMTEFFTKRDALGKLIQDAGSNPESLYRQMMGDVTKLDELKQVLDPKDFNALRGSFLDSLIKRNSEGFLMYETSINNIKKQRGRLSRMFSPQEIEDITDYLELGVAEGTPILSTAGSGPSMKLSDVPKDVKDSLFNEQVYNRMKARGRGAVPENEMILGLDKMTKETKATPKGFRNFKRGPMERRLKALQSAAPSTYERKEK